MTDPAVLEVALHDRTIGALTLFPGDQTLFAFDRDYVETAARPTLSLSFKDTLGGLITDLRPTRARVPPYFANLLPEGPLRTYLARKAGVNPRREFFLLRLLGRDLPGAVAIRPVADAPPLPVEASPSVEQRPEETLLRFSLAGVQLKFSAVMEATGGLTVPAEGVGGAWIVKLPSMKFARVPENEYAMMELARAVGIDVPEVRLVPLDAIAGLPDDLARMKGHALAVKRFDRSESGAVHMEDFAQVFGLYPEAKYERANYRNIAEVLWAETGAEGVAEFVRRLVFNALIGNADMHLKNWSLLYPDQRRAALAPGYDFVSTIAYLPDTHMALKLGRSKAMTDLSLERLTYFAAKAGLPKRLVLDAAQDTTRRFREVWRDGRAVRDISPETVGPIRDLLRRIPLVGESG